MCEPSEAFLIAISAVSAALWTGGLIVMQLRASEKDLTTTEVSARAADRITPHAAMGALGFAIIVPLIVLFPFGRLGSGPFVGLAFWYCVFTASKWHDLWKPGRRVAAVLFLLRQ